MRLWGTNRLEKRADPATAISGSGLVITRIGSSILSWSILGVAATTVAAYVLGLSSLPPKWLPIFLLAAVFPFVAVILGNARKLLLAAILLDIPIQWDTHFGYRTEAAELGAIGGLGISVTTLCLAALYALWIAELLISSRVQSRPVLQVSFAPALYLLFATLSILVARDVTLSFFYLFILLQMFLLYVYIVGTVRTKQDTLFIVSMLLLGLIAESLIMITVYLTGHNLDIAGISTRLDPSFTRQQQVRLGGTMRSPSVAAGYLSLLLAPALSLLFTRLDRRHKILAALAFGLAGAALVLTFSRGGWIAAALSIFIVSLLAWRRGWLSLTTSLTVGVVAFVLLPLFHDTILTRLLGDDMGSAYSRIPLMKLAFRVIRDKPVLGLGPNNFAIMISHYTRLGFSGEWLYSVHNTYLLIWAETGIGALVAFVFFLILTVRRGWQCWNLNDRLLSPLGLGFTAAIIGHMTHMHVDLFNGRLPGQLLWLEAGLIAAMTKMPNEGS